MKRPWNIISPPVYSLVTYDEHGKVNMNICTYVSAVSMKPKMYSIAIDYTTKTYKNLEKSSRVVLQLLSASNLKVILVVSSMIKTVTSTHIIYFNLGKIIMF